MCFHIFLFSCFLAFCYFENVFYVAEYDEYHTLGYWHWRTNMKIKAFLLSGVSG